MTPKKILVITDMDSNGSGYRNISVQLFSGLANMGHDIKIIGLAYNGAEHNFPFQILPCLTLEDARQMANNINALWAVDVFIVALDIPMQNFFFDNLKGLQKKYIAITPLENGPLVMDWAIVLAGMDSVFFISELGKQEAIKSGVTKAEHLMIGEDTDVWRLPFPEEQTTLRKGLGIGDREFVILTVADNQERKNLWAGIKAVSLLKEIVSIPLKYILVTRAESPFGWKLRSLAAEYNISKEFQIYERGLPQKDLWGLYAIADVYLQTSKAEGLCKPVMDAMACFVPVVATDTGALHELLDDSRGFLVPSEYDAYDVWGNEKRSFVNINMVKDALLGILELKSDGFPYSPTKALEYIKTRTWDIPCKQIDNKIRELFNEPKEG